MNLGKWSCMVVMCCLIISSPSFALTGTGSEADPYVIANRADFDAYCANTAYWSASVRLDADIDLTGTTYIKAPIAYSLNTSIFFLGTPFTGHFNGNGHKIIGLTILSYDKDYIGLFGKNAQPFA